MSRGSQELPFGQALFLISTTLVTIAAAVFYLRVPVYYALAGSLAVAMAAGLVNGWLPSQFIQSAGHGIRSVLPVLAILAVIGILSALWMANGTIAAIVYYGIKTIHPQYMVITSFLLASATSMLLGSSIATLSTLGAAVVTLGKGVGLSPALLAGALVSGAMLGDRTSPLSSTFHLAASTTETDPDKGQRILITTLIPASVISMAAYWFWGMQIAPSPVLPGASLTGALMNYFSIRPWFLLPPLLIIWLVLRRISTKRALIWGCLAGVVTGVVSGNLPLPDIVPTAVFGAQGPEAPELTGLFKGGGLMGMKNPILIIIFAGALNGVMERIGVMQALMGRFLHRVQGVGGLTLATVAMGGIVAAVACNQALAVIIPARLFRPAFHRRGLGPEVLMRVIADSGMVLPVLIPWNLLSILASSAIGVPAPSYALYAVLVWVLPVLTLVYPCNDQGDAGRATSTVKRTAAL